MGKFDVNIQLQNYKKKRLLFIDSNHFITEKGGGVAWDFHAL
jgi:hypothetical protein